MQSLTQQTRRWWFLPGLLLISGCDTLFKPPEVEPVSTQITNAQPPKGPVFLLTDGVKHWDDPTSKLNNDPKDPTKPDTFKVVDVVSGDLLKVAGIKTIKATKKGQSDTKVMIAPDIMRLAGIVVPAPNTSGWLDTVSKVREWVLNQEVDIERDPVYPIDMNGRNMVQVFFKPQAGKLKGQELNLNRMLVRLGLAVVDINSPTSIDVKPWLNDEQFARSHMEPATGKGGKDHPVSLGLWAKGIVLQNRQPAPTPIGAKVVVTRLNVAPQTIKETGKTVTRRNTSRITTSTTTQSSRGPATGGATTGGARTAGGATGGGATGGAAPGGAASPNASAYPGGSGAYPGGGNYPGGSGSAYPGGARAPGR